MKNPLPKKALLVYLLVSLIFPTLIFFILTPPIEKAIVDESTEEAFRVADYLGRHLGLSSDKLVAGARDEWIANEINYIKDSFTLREICIIAPDGRIAYSAGTETAEKNISPDLMEKVLRKGERYAGFSSGGERSNEGNVVAGSVVDVYVPVSDGGRIIGAIAVHYDITTVHGDIGRIKTLFAMLLFVLSFVVLIMISYYLVRSERVERRRHQAEDELVQEQIKAETVFSSMGDNIIIQDLDYKVIYQNAINRDIYGDRRGEFCYKVYEGLDHVCPNCPVELTYRDGGIHKDEKEVMTPKGPVSFELTASPLRNPAGEIVAGIKVVRDITERRKLEGQLRHVQKMDAIGTLTSGISHEFNNLLTSIIGFSELLMEMETGEEKRRYLEAIFTSGKRAEQLTRGLLAFSRKQIADRAPVLLNDIVRGLVPLMENMTGVDISLRLELSEEELVITADRNQIEQVIINITANGRDAIDGTGEIVITTAPVILDQEFTDRHGFGKEGDRLCLLSIRDNGSGMDSDTKEKIFEPFFTTKDVGKGTGLGLSIAYGIVTQHGGFMEVISAPGDGSEFRMYLG